MDRNDRDRRILRDCLYYLVQLLDRALGQIHEYPALAGKLADTPTRSPQPFLADTESKQFGEPLRVIQKFDRVHPSLPEASKSLTARIIAACSLVA